MTNSLIHVDDIYKNLIENVLENGNQREDRTNTGTISLFSPPKMEFDLTKGFPLLTTKKMPWKNTIRELVWFISGSTNVFDLPTETQKWWSPWMNKDGSLGPVYGSLWRSWPYPSGDIDQLQDVVKSIINNPESRRHIISTWHPGELKNQKLPCCHGLTIQFYVENKNLSCFVHQRSADLFLGFPVNIASYSFLLSLVAKICNLKAHKLHYSLGDAHIYLNHVQQIKEQIKKPNFEMPQLILNESVEKLEDFSVSSVELVNYKSHEIIKGDLAV